MDKTKLYKYYNIGIRSIIIIAAIFLIYYELSEISLSEYQNSVSVYLQQKDFRIILLTVLLMMPLNWFIEAAKWRYIVSSEEKISFSLALKAIFAGASVSSLSPNRMGDFLGRVFVLKKTSFLQGTFVTLIGSYAQTLISIIIGFFAMLFLALKRSDWESTELYSIFTLSTILITLIVFLYYKISVLSRIIPKKWGKIYGYIQVLSSYKFPQLTVILLYSLLRYFIFSTQFVLMLWAVGFHLPALHLYVLVSTIFFINMFRPSVALIEFAIRGAVSVSVIRQYYIYFRDMFIDNELSTAIIIASTLIWLINIILPALIGLLFIKDIKFFRLNKTET